MRGVEEREIQVLRKTVRFKVAFFEACSSLENPGLVKRCMLVDTCQQPTKHIVFLNDMRLKVGLCGQFNKFMFWYQAVGSISKESIAGTNSRQRVISLLPLNAVSS